MFEAPPRPISQIVFWLSGVITPETKGRRKLTTTQGMFDLIGELREDYTVGVLQEHGPPSFARTIDIDLYDQSFTPEVIINAADIASLDDYASFYAALINKTFVTPGECLLIDYHPLRSMAAVRAGLDCSVFVDMWRLRRDLWLWRILDEYELGRPPVV